MRPRISIRGFVRPSVGRSVGRSVGWSVTLELKTIANDRNLEVERERAIIYKLTSMWTHRCTPGVLVSDHAQ